MPKVWEQRVKNSGITWLQLHERSKREYAVGSVYRRGRENACYSILSIYYYSEHCESNRCRFRRNVARIRARKCGKKMSSSF